MPITPTKPDEQGVRWCDSDRCQHHNMCHLVRQASFCTGICHPWLWARNEIIRRAEAGDISPHAAMSLMRGTDADDIEPICRELGVIGGGDE